MSDPKKGTGKKPKGSGRRLYTDENPKDTVSVKFSTVQDIKDTLSKSSFKSKSHKRQSQIINLIHQRARAAYQNAKDPKVKARLKKAFDYATERKEASKRKTKRMQKSKNEIKDIIMQEVEAMMDEKKRKKRKSKRKKAGTESSKESSLRDWFGRKGAKGPLVRRVAGSIVTRQNTRMAKKLVTKPVVARRAKSAPSTQPAAQHPVPAKSAAKASLGERKPRRAAKRKA